MGAGSTISLPPGGSLTPQMDAASSAGTSATRRAMTALDTAETLRSRKPSITYCPASVPVMVEDWPLAIRDTANETPANLPSTALSILGAFRSGESIRSTRSAGDTWSSGGVERWAHVRPGLPTGDSPKPRSPHWRSSARPRRRLH